MNCLHLVCAIAMLAVGCSKMSAEEFVERYARERCAVVAHCTGQADQVRQWCVSSGDGARAMVDAARAISARRATYDVAHADECLDQMSNLRWCDDTLAADQACAAAIHGNAASGETCSSDWDCQSGGCESVGSVSTCATGRCLSREDVSARSSGNLVGQCSTFFTPASGLRCEGPSAAAPRPDRYCNSEIPCPDGERCDPASTLCVPIAVGDACPLSWPVAAEQGCGLVSGFYCQPSPSSQLLSRAGTCQRRLARGAACNVPLFETPDWMRVPTGSAMESDYDPCEVGLICVGAGLDTSGGGQMVGGTCKPIEEVGGPCRSPLPNELVYTGCKTGLGCRDGTCVLPPAQGACLNGLCAPGTYCDLRTEPNVCLPLLADGAPCIYGVECAGGYCVGLTSTNPDITNPGICGDLRCHEPTP